MKWILFSICLLGLVACTQDPNADADKNPTQAGQPINAYETAKNVAKVRVAAFTGDQEAMHEGVKAISDDFKKSIKLADPSRAVDRESARVAAKSLPGVRSAVWFDRENLFAIVERNEQKSYETIDAICLKLEPLGDTLGVVVNLQSGAASNGDELEILSRNCQLKPGDRAFMQKERQIDVLNPDIRKQHKANNTR